MERSFVCLLSEVTQKVVFARFDCSSLDFEYVRKSDKDGQRKYPTNEVGYLEVDPPLNFAARLVAVA